MSTRNEKIVGRHCNVKAPFASPYLARKVVNRDRKRKGDMTIYRCLECGHWHIGHSKGRATGWKYRS